MMDVIERRRARFARSINQAKHRGSKVSVLGLQGPQAGCGFYKLHIRVGAGRWWVATLGGICQLDYDPVEEQKRVTAQGNGLPSRCVVHGGVRELLNHPAAGNRPLGEPVHHVLLLLAQHWGTALDELKVAAVL